MIAKLQTKTPGSKYRTLYIKREGRQGWQLKDQHCPYQDDNCGEWCPMLEYSPDRPDRIVLKCNSVELTLES